MSADTQSETYFRLSVQRMYRELLGREADENGLQYWVSVAAAEKSLTQVREGILNSDESRFAQYSREPQASFSGYVESELSILEAFRNPNARPSPGFVTDFLGGRVRTTSLWQSARHLDGTLLDLPVPGDYRAETAEWIGLLKSVRSAGQTYTAIEVGAGVGPWVTAGGNAARLKGIQDIRLCAVEADPHHFALLRQNLQDNGFDPDHHTLIHAAVGTTGGTAQWPCCEDSSEEWGSRPLLENARGRDYLGRRFNKEIEIPLLPMGQLIRKEERWDLVHLDVQGHEVEICQSCIDEITRCVHWIVVGTHSRKLDGDMIELMYRARWMLENEKPAKFRYSQTAPTLEAMTTIDGIQVWRNPALD
jgi:FkbM family methyltransferase